MYKLNFIMKNGNIFITDYLEELEIDRALGIAEECNWILIKPKVIKLKDNSSKTLVPFKTFLRICDIDRIDIFEEEGN